MNFRHQLLFLLLLGSLFIKAQDQNYFQQQVDYNISAILDTTNQKLKVNCTINYTNNSANSLNEIYFHLWWNAYKDKNSAFANQKLKLADRSFYFAKEEELGGYDNIQFFDSGSELSFSFYNKDNTYNNDIVLLELNEPLPTGQSKEIVIEYVLDIPKLFSRGGYDGELYRFCQWYPKPAVYDVDGWHPMSYLELGEFYSEFGDFQVEFILPKGMQVVSTGQEVEGNNSSLRYQAENVHDFAWACSASFNKVAAKMEIDNKEVDIFLFTNHSENHEAIIKFAEQGIEFYSEQVGSYPYPQMTIVLNKNVNRTGMEYPMLTIIDHDKIDSDLDHLVAHEIGHNWFYSLLGSNERSHAWMDEGLNSFYDHKYHMKYYGELPYEGLSPNSLKSSHPEYSDLKNGIRHLHCSNRLCQIDRSADSVHPISYIANSYERMVMCIDYLEGYLGSALFNKAIKTYYQQWSNKHPQPSDLEYVFESTSGKNLDWFFKDLITSDQIFDYKIGKIEKLDGVYKVTVENSNDFNIPIHLTSYDASNKIINNIWVEVEDQGSAIKIVDDNFHRLSINGAVPFLDVDRKNNHYINNKLKPPVGFKFGYKQNESTQRNINWIPTANYNTTDGLGLGLLFANSFYPYNKLRWFVNPVFGLKSKLLTGVMSVERDFRIPTSTAIRKLTLGVYGRRYGELESGIVEFDYYRITPSIKLHFEKELESEKYLEFKSHLISTNDLNGEENSFIQELRFKQTKYNRLSKNSLQIQLFYENYDDVFENSNNYLKLALEYSKSVYYREDDKFYLRFFGGYFLQNSNREVAAFLPPFGRSAFAITQQGFTDYLHNDYYIGRNEFDGFWTRQVTISEGGFKMPIDQAHRIGLSNDYMATVNLKIDLPFKIFKIFRIRPFADFGIVSTKSFNNEDLSSMFLYSGGLSLEAGDSFSIYVPLLYADEYDVVYNDKNLFDKISFRINFQQLNLWNKSDDPISLIHW